MIELYRSNKWTLTKWRCILYSIFRGWLLFLWGFRFAMRTAYIALFIMRNLYFNHADISKRCLHSLVSGGPGWDSPVSHQTSLKFWIDWFQMEPVERSKWNVSRDGHGAKSQCDVICDLELEYSGNRKWIGSAFLVLGKMKGIIRQLEYWWRTGSNISSGD